MVFAVVAVEQALAIACTWCGILGEGEGGGGRKMVCLDFFLLVGALWWTTRCKVRVALLER